MKKLLLVANVSKEHIRKFHIPFIKRMKQNDWQVDVACRMDEPVPECDYQYDLPCDRNPFDGGIWSSVKILKKVIKENQYDVVHCNTITGSMIARLAAAPYRKNGLKVFYTNHGLHFFRGASLSRWFIGYPMDKFLASKTDVFITINKEDSEMAKKHLKGCGAFEQIHGIGVDLSRFRRTIEGYNCSQYRAENGLSDQDFILTYVAEIIENKNQEVLLNVLCKLKMVIPEAKLVLIGPDYEEGRLQKKAEEMGLKDSVVFLGWRNDIPQLLKMSDVYVASSKSEGLGLNLIEAMACNLPVVALKNRGHCEIIAHGQNGFLIEQQEYDKMTEQIRILYYDKELRERIINQAQVDITKYEVESVLDELEVIYKKYV